MSDLAAIGSKLKLLGFVLLLGLVVMTGLCAWQRQATHRQGDEALARSWGDATRSFAGMLVAACGLGLAGWWVYGLAVEVLASYGGSP